MAPVWRFCLLVCIVQLFVASTQAGQSSEQSGSCPAYVRTDQYRKTNYKDFLNTTKSISPRRATANVPKGSWIPGRATFYGADDALERSRVACGEPAGQFGIIAQGSCGYTNSDGSLPFPKDMYAAAADTNLDYPGSCGRCYQVRVHAARSAPGLQSIHKTLHSTMTAS